VESRIIKVDKDINKNIGSYIKELREARGISQYYLGIAIGLSEEIAQQHIYKYEKGIIRIPLDVAFSIAKTLNVELIINGDNMIFIPR
jgi:transcriptional regulator with XRE-family HTH domain